MVWRVRAEFEHLPKAAWERGPVVLSEGETWAVLDGGSSACGSSRSVG